jgi:hypothetical protein
MRISNEKKKGQHVKAVTFKLDDFVISPTSALRFISLSLRRTISTPHDTKFARFEFGTYYKAVTVRMWRALCANGVTAQVIFRQDLQDEQDFGKPVMERNHQFFSCQHCPPPNFNMVIVNSTGFTTITMPVYFRIILSSHVTK